MFLIPACLALLADGLIVYLHRSLATDLAENAADTTTTTAAGGAPFLYKVGYLTLLAWIRIICLLFPFLFHSYTGTALPCHVVYVAWYVITLSVVLGHMLALCVLNPESLQALVPEPAGYLEHLHLYRRLWYTLLLSVAAHLSHFVLVLHVKSSAPTLYSHHQQRRHGGINGKPPPVSLYFAIRAQMWQDEPALVHVMNGESEATAVVVLCVSFFWEGVFAASCLSHHVPIFF